MSRRTEKVQEAVRETVAMAILSEVQDPRVKNVTVISCKVSGDLRVAKVNVSVMGTDTQQQLCLKGLQSCAGFLQTKIAQRIKSRYVPCLEFALDQGVKRSIEVSRILKEVLPPKEQSESLEDEESNSDLEAESESGSNTESETDSETDSNSGTDTDSETDSSSATQPVSPTTPLEE